MIKTQFFYNGKAIIILFVVTMFQRHKFSHQINLQQPTTSTLRVGQIVRKVTPLQIRQHMKKNIYINPRASLIQNTKNLIKQHQIIKETLKHHTQNHSILDKRNYRNKSKFNQKDVQMSSRQTRVAAARKIRERMWKSSDITHLIKAHEQEKLRQKTANCHDLSNKYEKMHRYQDSVVLEQNCFSQKILENTKNSYKAHQSKDTDGTQLNFQLSSQFDQFPPSNLKQKNYRYRYHSVIASQQKRANTTRKIKRFNQEENFIEPW